MFKLVFGSILFVSLVGAIFAQDYQDYETNQRSLPVRVRQAPIDNKPTPVPILKQINRHNEDGSYTYGYEGADGSFKIETKLATGEVKGKYGYVDETGKVRVVEYGANKYGFQPSGEGITVAPPTLVDETTNKDRPILDYEDGPQTEKPYIARVSRPQVSRPAPQSYSRPQFIDYEQEQEPIQPRVQQYIPQAQAPAPRPQHSPAPAPPRLQIPGAQQIPGDVVYSSQQRPARPDPEYTQSQTFSLPQQFKQLQRPIFSPAGPSRGNPEPQQSYVPRQSPPLAYAAPSPPQGRSTSVLDQLAKDYALPQGGAQPLHDISFGYY